MTDTKRAAIYARVSTDEQSNNFSLGSQVDYCRDYINRNGYELAAEPFREDFTGTVADRPELDHVRELAQAGQFTRLIVLELDRLGRGLVMPFILEQEFKKLGVTIEYVQETYDDTPEGALKKGMRATISEYERLKILERTKRGRMAKAKAKNVMCSSIAKYGYEVARDGRDSTYCIVSDEAAIVLLIYRWYVHGDETGRKLQPSHIARRLSEMGVPTRTDKLGGKHSGRKRQRFGVWHKKTVWAILKDETYAGTAYFGRSKRLDVNGKKKQVLQPRSAWIPIPVPVIVPCDLWEAAQRTMAANRYDPAVNSRNNKRSVHLMRSRLVCSKCGHVLTYVCHHVNTPHPRGYYHCAGSKPSDALNHERTCKGNLRQEEIDAAIWEKFVERLKNPEYIQESYRRDQRETAQHNAPIAQRLEIVQRLLDEKTAERANLLDQYLKNLFPADMLESRATELNMAIQGYEAEKADLEARKRQVRLDENSLAGLIEYSKQFRAGVDSLTLEERRRAVELFDLRGVATREGNEYWIEVTGIIPDSLIVTGQIRATSLAPQRPNFTFLIHGQIKAA